MKAIAGIICAFLGYHLGVFIQTGFPSLAFLFGDGGTEQYISGRYSTPSGMLPIALIVVGFIVGYGIWSSLFDKKGQ